MLTVVQVPESGPARVVDSAPTGPPAGSEILWIDIETPTAEVLEALRVPFGLHPLAIEDCLTFDQRAKLEEYPGHVFVVVHELSLEGTSFVEQEVHAFLGKQFLITVHEKPCRRIDMVRQHVVGDDSLHARGAGFIYYLLADSVACHNATALDALAEKIEDIEDRIFQSTKRTGSLQPLFQLKRALGSARRTLSPQRDLFSTLARSPTQVVSERTAFYFRDVYDKIARTAETIETSRDLLSSVLEAHFSLVSQRTNEIMKHLTVLSAIFLPLTFVTGFFGQNFEGLPFRSHALMWSALLTCVVLPPAMLYWFRHRRWL
ncbi:MAG TPA: magnesium/cobalt transporter CorA [Polyangiaceae bacterium]|nr:magnesium/cobalt transporter CorA [Polyangiaceae bacterium]